MSGLGLLRSVDGLRFEVLLRACSLSLLLLGLLEMLSGGGCVAVSIGVDGAGGDGSLWVVND